MSSSHFDLNPRDVARRFAQAAQQFSDADFAHRQIADGLFERLDAFNAKPKRIADLGCGTGHSSVELARRYRRAQVIAIDASSAMLARVPQGWFSRIRRLNADACRLPLQDHSLDLAFANLLLPWTPNPDPLFGELGRVLSRDAPFVFSTLGPDSFAALRDAFGDVDDRPRINGFADMHDIGDGLVRAGLRDPVLDVDHLTVTYRDSQSLFRDLTNTGARNSLRGRRPGLMGRKQFAAAVDRLTRDGQITITLEIVYGHAFGSGQREGEFRVDIGQVPIRRAKNS